MNGPVSAQFGMIKLKSPADGEVLGRKNLSGFRWDNGGYDKFRVELSASPSFGNKAGLLTIPEKGWSSHRLKLSRKTLRYLKKLSGDEPVYWRVIGKDSGKNSASSDVRSLRLE